MEITVMGGQTIYDLALQYGGGIDAVMEIYKQNQDQLGSMDAPLLAGMKLKLETVVDKDVAGYFSQRKMDVNSRLTEPATSGDEGGGGDPQPSGSFNDSFNNSFD